MHNEPNSVPEPTVRDSSRLMLIENRYHYCQTGHRNGTFGIMWLSLKGAATAGILHRVL